jgi:membrane complex biogenesis BtpA family protein
MENDPMSEWIKSLFRHEKPVIAMAHIPALPGTPRYNEEGGINYLIEKVLPDVQHLEQEGVDAVMFCNEDDRPYVFHAGIEQVSAMTRVVTECTPQSIPFGVDFLWDPMAAMAIAHASGASFIREVCTGMYESDMGLWSANAGKTLRFQRSIGAKGIRVFYNILPEFASSLGTRTVSERARSAIVSSLADVILVSGLMAGEEPDIRFIEEIKNAVGDFPVLLNTGAKVDNIEAYLQVADGVIVGSSLKVDGYTWNEVDPGRVRSFMEKVGEVRGATR